jgi:hypothetical protein
MLRAEEAESVAMATFIRELHKAGVSFAAINKSLAGATAELSAEAAYAPALSFIKEGTAIIGICADAQSAATRSQ